jgi:SAM-dependent methyltransferase
MTTSAFWDERYGAAELVYGAVPNEYLVEVMKGLGWSARAPSSVAAEPGEGGRALDIGAGEGRNALFLASLGFDVLAVDQSAVGMAKAARLAAERGLKLRTVAADLREFDVEPASLDVVSSIYVHMPAEIRSRVHGRVAAWLKPGGVFVLEAYAPDQIARGTGGPKDPALLAPLETIVSELKGLKIMQSAAKVRVVNEGVFHTGEASVVQVLAKRE